jgi:hypothetical protein
MTIGAAGVGLARRWRAARLLTRASIARIGGRAVGDTQKPSVAGCP